jgi:hypothetical protein
MRTASDLFVLLCDQAYLDRLAAFLRSVGLHPRSGAGAGNRLEVEADSGELEVYLRVWHVMNPDAEVLLGEA